MDRYEGNVDRGISEVADDLGDLLKLDVDAVQAYNEAIEKIEAKEVRARLSAYRDDHERHVTELTEAIRGLGQEPPSPSPDIKGKLIEGMTALRGSMGDDQALKAMRQNEQITNKAYEEASTKTWPGDIQSVIERNYADERQHLQWIEQQLAVTAGAHGRSTY
jgi:uncharacterized protein (TIGR02284 family)